MFSFPQYFLCACALIQRCLLLACVYWAPNTCHSHRSSFKDDRREFSSALHPEPLDDSDVLSPVNTKKRKCVYSEESALGKAAKCDRDAVCERATDDGWFCGERGCYNFTWNLDNLVNGVASEPVPSNSCKRAFVSKLSRLTKDPGDLEFPGSMPNYMDPLAEKLFLSKPSLCLYLDYCDRSASWKKKLWMELFPDETQWNDFNQGSMRELLKSRARDAEYFAYVEGSEGSKYCSAEIAGAEAKANELAGEGHPAKEVQTITLRNESQHYSDENPHIFTSLVWTNLYDALKSVWQFEPFDEYDAMMATLRPISDANGSEQDKD